MDESGKATIKSAIDLVKPLYFSYVDTLLATEGDAIKDQLLVAETHDKVLVYHYLNRLNPGMERVPAF